MVRAKFKCTEKKQTENGHSVRLEPVTHGSAENERFFKWTPWGSMELGIINDAAAEQFVPGKAFYVDFTACEE